MKKRLARKGAHRGPKDRLEAHAAFRCARLTVSAFSSALAAAEKSSAGAERQAINAPLQGSAADIIKRAMLGIDADIRSRDLGSRMLLQVHDELVLEVAAGELDVLTEIVRSRMAGAAELSVPLDVQLGSGPNWDAAAH